jgi:hypothetical protein
MKSPGLRRLGSSPSESQCAVQTPRPWAARAGATPPQPLGGVLSSDQAALPPEEHVMTKRSMILGVGLALVLLAPALAGAAQRVVLAEMFGGTW